MSDPLAASPVLAQVAPTLAGLGLGAGRGSAHPGL